MKAARSPEPNVAQPFHVVGRNGGRRASRRPARQINAPADTETFSAMAQRLCGEQYGEVMYDVLGAK